MSILRETTMDLLNSDIGLIPSIREASDQIIAAKIDLAVESHDLDALIECGDIDDEYCDDPDCEECEDYEEDDDDWDIDLDDLDLSDFDDDDEDLNDLDLDDMEIEGDYDEQ